jgi:hydroxycarboxylate dehydrogenase B
MAIAAAPLRDLVQTIFERAGSEPAEAAAVADHLIEANLMGHDSHGVIRVAPYIELVRAGKWAANRHVRIVKDAGAVVVVDGEQGLGQVIAKEAIDLGIERARQHGVAIVGVRNSGHMGRIGAWAEQAAAAGLVSLHFVNTTGFGIQVAPFGGSDRRLSVNPIALGAPRPGREPLIHDMSTGAIAAGKIRVARNKGALLPEGAIIDNRGQPTRDPEAFFTDPPGALVTAGGHKGYGLALFVEILAGALAGGGSGHPDNPSADRPINGLLSILIDPDALAGSAALAADLERLVAYVTASPPAVPGGKVLLPGEIERRTRAERQAHGIPLDPNTLDQLRGAARTVGLSAPEIERGIIPTDTSRQSQWPRSNGST